MLLRVFCFEGDFGGSPGRIFQNFVGIDGGPLVGGFVPWVVGRKWKRQKSGKSEARDEGGLCHSVTCCDAQSGGQVVLSVLRFSVPEIAPSIFAADGAGRKDPLSA